MDNQPQSPEPQKHRCGQCNGVWYTEQEYLDHTCESTGFKPTDPEHLGEDFARVSEAALARGAKRQELESQGVHPEEAKVLAKDEGSTIA